MFSAVPIVRKSRRAGVRELAASRPLATFFVLAYLGSWLVLLPLLLAQNGLGILSFRLPLYIFLILATLFGPALSAVVVAWLVEGRAGIGKLLARYRTGRAEYGWCLVALYGPLLAIVAICLIEGGTGALGELVQQPLAFLSSYSAFLFMGLLAGPLGEELGWRGFALPRLQKAIGPLWASLVLGVVWAGWHLPLFFLPEWKGAATPQEIGVAFFSWVIPFTVIMTWVYNSAGGNTLVATLMHAGENAAVSLIGLHLLAAPTDLFLQSKVYAVLAVALIVVTRGKLAIDKFREVELMAPRAPGNRARRLTPQRLALYAILAVVAAYVVVNLAYGLITGATR